VWSDGPDDDLATQLWALDGSRGIAEPWHWAATNSTSPQLVLNEVGYGPTRRHAVPLDMPTENDADAVALSAVRRLRLESAPTTAHWGDAGCNGHGSCDVVVGACKCFTGFGGSNCDIEVNECVSRPCHHGGACMEGQRAGTYACLCTPDAFGGDCERWTTVQALIILEGDVAAVGTAASQERDDFENVAATDLAALLEVAQSRIVIDSVAAGSLVVGFSVRADAAGNPVAAAAVLHVLGANGVNVAGLQVQEVSVTRQADADDVLTANATDILENGGGGSGSSSASWSE